MLRYRKSNGIVSFPLLFVLLMGCGASQAQVLSAIPLPEPLVTGVTIEETIQDRRSIRNYSDSWITLEELSGILFAAQGVTSPTGFRAAPSAGATYPLFIFVAVSRVDSLLAGTYLYDPNAHALVPLAEGDRLAELEQAALGQSCISSAPAVIVISADFSRTTSVYGERGESYVYIEVGHAAQNIYLTCTAMGLGTVAVGAFHDNRVAEVLELPDDFIPLYLMPVGEPADS